MLVESNFLVRFYDSFLLDFMRLVLILIHSITGKIHNKNCGTKIQQFIRDIYYLFHTYIP